MVEREKNHSDTRHRLDPLNNELLVQTISETRKINEGANGVIFKMNAETTRSLMNILGLETDVTDKTQIYKLLKIYSPGAGRREFENQYEAYDIAGGLDAQAAKVPKPNAYLEITVTDELRDFLRIHCPGIAVHQYVEILVMDYIPGVDLATWLFHNACKFVPGYDPTNPPTEWSEMDAMISSHLQFERPTPSPTAEESMLNKRKTAAANSQKLIQFLQANNFVLNKEILNKLSFTLDAFARHGFSHGDLHERNIMITSPDSENPDVYIIDFATGVSEGINAHDRSGNDDGYLVRTYTPLTETRIERNNGIINKAKAELADNISRYANQRSEEISQILQLVPKDARDLINRLISKFINSSINPESKIFLFLAACQAAIIKYPDFKDDIVAILEKKIKPAQKTKRNQPPVDSTFSQSEKITINRWLSL